MCRWLFSAEFLRLPAGKVPAMKPPPPIYSYLAGAGLAVLTLFIFFVFRDFGPQGVIRRFHEAAVSEQPARIAGLTVEPYSSGAALELVGLVRELRMRGARFEIAKVQRFPGLAAAAVEYRFPNGATWAQVWFVQQEEARLTVHWRINCLATLTQGQRGLSPRPGIRQ